MAVRTKKFEFQKDVPTEEINRFYQENNIDRTQILSVVLIQKTPNAGVYMITYEDIIQPYVIGTSPSNGSDGVPTGSAIIIQFSEAVTALTPSDVEVLRNGSPVALVGGDIVTVGARTTISNAIDGTVNADYVVTIRETVTDLVGNAMSAPYVFNFTSQTEFAGLALKAGRIAPGTGDIAAGFSDVSFVEPFTNDSYRLSGFSFHHGAPYPPQDLPSCQVSLSADKTAIGTAWHEIDFQNKDSENDPDVLEHGDVNQYIITAKENGLYRLSLNLIVYDPAADFMVRAVKNIDGTPVVIPWSDITVDPSFSPGSAVTPSANVELLAGDTVSVEVSVSAGASGVVRADSSMTLTKQDRRYAPFRVTNKVAGGFRVNFDSEFPLGGALEWMAIFGASS
jgi:hypothetical protein